MNYSLKFKSCWFLMMDGQSNPSSPEEIKGKIFLTSENPS